MNRTRLRHVTASMVLRAALTLALALFTGHAARAENWPQFRGPTGMGISGERDLPRSWNAAKNEGILWKSPLPHTRANGKPDRNQSSPIVWGDRVLVASAYWPDGAKTADYPKQHVTCYRVADGTMLWDTLVPPGPWKLSDLRGGYAAPTPATDGERVYVAFGSATLAALDMQGKIIWQQHLENPTAIDVALASSPIVFGKQVILLVDRNGQKATLTAYDAVSGSETWVKKRPQVQFNHSTPTLVTVGGKPQLLIAASNALQGIDPASGEVIWFCSTPGDVTSPILHAGLVYCDNGRGGTGIAVDPTGTGDVTKTHVRWKTKPFPEALSSPVVSGGLLFRTHNGGVLKCFRWDDGSQQFGERFEGISSNASPIVSAEGLVYLVSGGRSYVLQPGEKPTILERNDLDDPSDASPAVSGGRLFIKGGKYLYCIGKK